MAFRYKLSVGHGLLRRWYGSRVHEKEAAVPPFAIVRLRPDHLLTARWNLTAASLEFGARAAARASGGNFLAVWGPSAHSRFCGGHLCGDTFKTPNCYGNGRLDDAFAFGTPAAMDACVHDHSAFPHSCFWHC